MAEEDNALITIDLTQFKLYVNIEDKIRLSLHFDSESRRFYLAVIALVLHEMKKLGEIKSIPLEKHYDTLALLNETVGGGAGSSDTEKLLPRVYRKWKDALPDLEHAPLFRVLGKKKEYDDAVGKTFQFTDEEKDAWANLFDYKGSYENARLSFSIDKLGATLDDVLILFEDDANPAGEDGWYNFLNSLDKSTEEDTEQTTTQVDAANPAVSSDKGREPWYRRKALLPLIIAVVAVAGAVAVWNFYLRPSPPQFEPASIEKMALPLPDKPSIAVLPFEYIGGDPKYEYIADGMTEDIITSLSKISNLFVIARNSVFTYKGKPVKVQQVSEELGVRYVLEGSVQKAGDRVRITTQLVDATKGHHLWAERYDRELKDIFALQEEIAQKIVSALEIKLTEGEEERAWRKYTDNPEAYDYFLRGIQYMYIYKKEANARARQMFERAVELDPEFAPGYAWIGCSHLYDVWYQWSKSPAQSYQLAFEMAQKALAMDDSVAYAYNVMGWFHLMKRQHEKAIVQMERAISLDPNLAKAHADLGMFLFFSGRPEEAILPLKRGMRLDPMYPPNYPTSLGIAYEMTGRYDEAIAEMKKALHRNPDFKLAHLRLAVTYGIMGKEAEARAEAAEVRRIDPKFSVEYWAKMIPYKNKEETARVIYGLRKAGLME